jgi:outer membrane protein TolC
MKKAILNTLALFLFFTGFGQTTAEILKYRSPKLAVDTIAEALAQLAVENPQIKMAAYDAKSAEYTWRASKYMWSNAVFAAANLNEYTINKKKSQEQGITTLYPRYNLGLRITLGDFLVNPKTTKANYYKFQSETEKSKKAAQDIKKEVIIAYQEYALSQKLQALQEEILQDELVAFTKGEQRFKNGEISLDAYTLALKTYNDEQVKNETLKKELRVKQATLESYLGMSMEDAFIQIGALLSQQAPVTESQNSGGVINK